MDHLESHEFRMGISMSKKIAVIDGNSLMHRAYHAIQTPMIAPDGSPTNAVFGFMQMLCKFIEEAGPDGVVCAFDEGKPAHRIEEMPGYKAQRPHMDDELRVQFPIIEKLLSSMSIPIVKVPGWEGDDILGTIAARDEKLGFETLLVTGDKDACQLATELTKIVTTKKGISDVVIFGPDEVMEKYGVTPTQFIDYLGLMGDSSDNIPGVPGIGPKSAQKLLEKYGDIEGIYSHIDELKGKQKENLAENEKMAYLSRQIATIVCDLDFSLDLEEVSFPDFDPDEVEKTFKEYALASPLTRVLNFVGKAASIEVLEIDSGERIDPKDARMLVDSAVENLERIGFAYTEEGGDTLFGTQVRICLSTSQGSVILDGDQAMDMLVYCLKNASLATEDLKAVIQLAYPPDTSKEALITLDELYGNSAMDISLAAYVLRSTTNDYSLDKLAEQYLGGEIVEAEDPDEDLLQKAALTRMLAGVLDKALVDDGSVDAYFDIDLPLVNVLAQMERIGVAIDTDKLSELGRDAAGELTELASEIYAQAGEEFNIDSPKQLSHILFEKMGLKPIKKNQRGFSTDASVLGELAKTEKIASSVLRYRELAKIKSTYIDSLPKMRGDDARIHTVFHETVTATGRLSSSDPNLQNIPVRTDFGRRIRECFIPLAEDEVFLSADYSQIELRLLAHLSGDEGLIEAFRSGADFHAQTAARVFGVDVDDVTSEMRSKAKAVNFGIVYGQQAYGLSQTLDIDFGEAKEMIERYYEAYPGVRTYLDSVIAHASETGYAETMFGRKRHIPELRGSNKQRRGFGERTAMNHPMQGSAADIIKLAMIEVQARLRAQESRAKLMLQVHDELDLSVPKDEVDKVAQMVKEVMESVVELSVPLVVDVSWADDWASAH